MSTNFYIAPHLLTDYEMPYVDHDDEGLHIGKRSMGHVFVFRAHMPFGITTFTAWTQRIGEARSIVDEAGRGLHRARVSRHG